MYPSKNKQCLHKIHPCFIVLSAFLVLVCLLIELRELFMFCEPVRGRSEIQRPKAESCRGSSVLKTR